MDKGSHRSQSLATILPQTFEKYVVEEEVKVTEGDPNDSNLLNTFQNKKFASRRIYCSEKCLKGKYMDVHGQHQSFQ